MVVTSTITYPCWFVIIFFFMLKKDYYRWLFLIVLIILAFLIFLFFSFFFFFFIPETVQPCTLWKKIFYFFKTRKSIIIHIKECKNIIFKVPQMISINTKICLIRLSYIFEIPNISNEKPSISIQIPSISIEDLVFWSKYLVIRIKNFEILGFSQLGF